MLEFIILGLFYACSNYSNVIELIEDYASEVYSRISVEDINNIYLIPSAFIPITIGDDETIDLTFALSQAGGFHFPETLEESINKPTTIDGYTPINKKLLTREYNYLVVSNEVGATEDLAYEHFKTTKCNFFLSCVPTATGNAILTPQSYGNIGGAEPFNYDYSIYGIPLGKFPMVSINFDYYRIWLQNNSFNITTGAITSGIESLIGVGQAGLNAYSGNLGGTTSGLSKSLGIFNYALNLQREIYMKRRIPPVTISQTSNSEIFASGNYNYLGFSFYQFCIKREFAEIIDNFFSMFGYKVNIVKIPNITGRQNWNFVKLLNPNIEGTEIPEFELNEFKAQLENGITFWHNPLTFRDYSQSNNIVT